MELDLTKLKINDKVLLCHNNNACDCISEQTSVTRITKTKVIVKVNRQHTKEQYFRKSDGYDMGPTTTNVYYLRAI